MTIPPAEATLLRRLEEELLNPEVRRSPDQVGDLLSDDFVEFGSSGGVFNKQQVIEALEQEGPSDPAIRLSLVDFTARRLASDVVLVTYRIIQEGGMELGKSPDCEAQSGNRSKGDGKWSFTKVRLPPCKLDCATGAPASSPTVTGHLARNRSWNSGLRSITSRTNQHCGTTLRLRRPISSRAPRTRW